MEERDGDTWYCYYAVTKLHWKPSEFAFLPPRERALMYAFIEEKIRSEDKQAKKLKSGVSKKTVKRGGRR